MPLNGKFLCVVIIDSTEECFLTNGKMYACNIFKKKVTESFGRLGKSRTFALANEK